MPTVTGLTSLTSESNSTSGPLTYSLSAEGSTPGLAFAKIQSHLETDLYVGDVQIVAFSTHLNALQFGVCEKYLERLGPLDKTAYAVATPSVRQLFQAKPAAGGIPAVELESSFKCHDCQTVDYGQHLWDLETALPTPGNTIWMPYVVGHQSYLDTGRMVLYHGLTPALVLSRQDTMYMGLTMGRTGKGYIHVPDGGRALDIRTLTASPRVSITASGGKLHLRVHLSATGTLDSWVGPPLNPAILREIEYRVDDYLAQHVLTVLDEAKRHQAAPNGWLSAYIWHHPGWKKPSVWLPRYEKADLTVTVKFHVTSVGDTNT